MADAAATGDVSPPNCIPLARALQAVATEIDNTATRARLQAA